MSRNNRNIAQFANPTDGVISLSDSGVITFIGGTKVYSSVDSFPTTGVDSFSTAWNSSTNRYYLFRNNGWYNIQMLDSAGDST
tara:strand:- start:312 stop:560 length:249 start_codon:yes stop_codon:yes gene_type:complete